MESKMLKYFVKKETLKCTMSEALQQEHLPCIMGTLRYSWHLSKMACLAGHWLQTACFYIQPHISKSDKVGQWQEDLHRS